MDRPCCGNWWKELGRRQNEEQKLWTSSQQLNLQKHLVKKAKRHYGSKEGVPEDLIARISILKGDGKRLICFLFIRRKDSSVITETSLDTHGGVNNRQF